MSKFDTVILGSSPNALTVAAYLARSGEKVLVIEPAEQVGSFATGSEFSPGFRADLGLISGQLDPKVVSDLNLEKHGLEVIKRDTLSSLLPAGRSFTLSADRKAAAEAIRKFSVTDADKYEKFMQLLDMAAELLKNAYSMTSPGSQPGNPASEQNMVALVSQLRGFGRREMTEVMRLLVMSVRHFLDEWFESAELKGVLATPGVRSLLQGPFAGATTFTLLHHLAIGDAYFRSTARGGVSAISRALAAAAKSFGAEIRTGVQIKSICVNDGVATGVELSNEKIEAARVISDFDADYTFRKLIAPPELEPEFNRLLPLAKYNGCVARINLALKELPKFEGLSEEALRGTVVLAPSIAYLEKAYDASKYGKLSEKPYLELVIPSLSDPSVAPAGKHVMSIWMQYAAYRSKELTQERVLELALTALSEHSPNLKTLVTASQVVTAKDLEKQFNLTEGHLYGGEMSLTQAFYLRPLPGYAEYRGPLENLYLCGASTHPGGGINALAATNLLKELGVKTEAPCLA